MQLDGCAYVRGWYLWCSACVCPMGLRGNFFYTQHQSLLPVEAQTCGWTGSVSLSPTVPRRAPQAEEWTCQCVCECETCEGFERIVF